MVRRGWVAALALLWSGAAQAEWFQARSPHFLVYAEGTRESVEKTARQLEQFDASLRAMQNAADPVEAHANPLTIYVVRSVSMLQKLCGGCSNVLGFYRPRVAGSVAFTPRAVDGSGAPGGLSPRIVLFHEYGHHFLFGTYASALPYWFSEGYAEFVSTAFFTDDKLVVGSAAQHRGYDLFNGNLSTAALFASTSRSLNSAEVAQVYARGWLLTHYLTFDRDRGRQFADFMKRLNAGEPSLDAAKAAFGDLKKLDRDLAAYLNRRHLSGVNITLADLPKPPIDVRPLTPGEAAMVQMRMESTAGVDEKQAASLYRRAGPVAAAYPDDPVVQGWFAEMAYDAGADDVADAAAGRAIDRDPKSAQGLLYRARAHLRRAAKTKDPAAFVEARSWIIKANRVDNNDADALSLFYYSFLQADETPRKSAIQGLERAMDLVPQDPSLRIATGRQAIQDGDAMLARRALKPLAYSPHAGEGGDLGGYAARLLALVDGGRIGREALAAFDADLLAKAKAARKN